MRRGHWARNCNLHPAHGQSPHTVSTGRRWRRRNRKAGRSTCRRATETGAHGDPGCSRRPQQFPRRERGRSLSH
ncbi:hypothetical protein [Ornithinimicrobium kibberense]|uniref:hypothetical protein n=1 Tax=Ornithinimicrobium kibberense TaxID=282060 RepID=UPI0036187AA7